MYVRHPRYGGTPLRSSDLAAQAEVLQRLSRRSAAKNPEEVWTKRGIVYPSSAISVRLLNRGYWDPSVRVCVDRGAQCRTCGRWFLFWALEQKHWYDTLGFYCYADCLDCWECRRDLRHKKNLSVEYEGLMAQSDKSVAEWGRLSALGDQLFQIGYIKKRETLLKTRMPKRLRRMI